MSKRGPTLGRHALSDEQVAHLAVRPHRIADHDWYLMVRDDAAALLLDGRSDPMCFACPTCGAPIGAECTWRRPARGRNEHLARQDSHARLFGAVSMAAGRIADRIVYGG
jgi:hypothetical protein